MTAARKRSSKSRTWTWQVAQAIWPPHAPSTSMPSRRAASSRLAPSGASTARRSPPGRTKVTSGKETSDLEALAAAAAALLVRVLEHELGAQLVLDPVELGAEHVHHGHRVDHDLHAIRVHDLLAGRHVLGEVEL